MVALSLPFAGLGTLVVWSLLGCVRVLLPSVGWQLARHAVGWTINGARAFDVPLT
jgi:hypothetical protein